MVAVSLPPVAEAEDLPPPDDPVHTHVVGAYQVCLVLEKAVASNDRHVMYARILGYLILKAPSIQAMHEMAKEIHSCEGEQQRLCSLGEFFLDYFIRPFKKFKGRTPASSYHSSRPSFDQQKLYIKSQIRQAPKNHREAKEQALIRDGFRCVVTGKYDAKGEDLSIVTMTEVLDTGGIVNTECAHIIPDSTYFNISAKTDTDTNAKDYASSVLAILKRFGYGIKNLNGEKVHSLFNVMTMEMNVHDWFDRLQMWFEKTPSLNCYRVCTARKSYVVPQMVTFTSSDPINLPLPSGELLALHAACAKVANLSGAAEWLDKIADDKDRLETLAPDGSSSNVLNHAIWESLGPLVDPVL